MQSPSLRRTRRGGDSARKKIFAFQIYLHYICFESILTALGMKTTILLTVLLLFACLFSGCLKSKDEYKGKCGDEQYESISATQFYLLVDSVQYEMYYSWDNINQISKVVLYSKIYDSICTDEHVRITVDMEIDTSGSKITPMVRADWYVLYGSEITLSHYIVDGVIQYSGDYSIGLKQIYEDRPGKYFLTWSFTFPSQGSRQNDLIWLNNRVKKLFIQSHYYWYKGI